MNDEAGFDTQAARYARGQKAVHCKLGGFFKTRAMRLCCALGGRYSHREGAYIMSPNKATKLQQLYADGWDASTVLLTLIPPQAANHE